MELITCQDATFTAAIVTSIMIVVSQDDHSRRRESRLCHFFAKKVSAIDQFFWPRCERLIRFHVSVAGSNPVMAMVA